MILISTLSHFKYRYTLIILSVLAIVALWFGISSSVATPLEAHLKKDTAERYQEIHFVAEKGVLYTLQKSSDLVHWNDDISFIGGGKLMKLRLFALNPNVAPENGNDAPYEPVSVTVRSVSSGGTYVSWISLEDQTIKHAHLTAVELDPFFPDNYTGLKNGYYLFLNLNTPLTIIDSDSAVAGKDLNFKNALTSILTGINNDSKNGTPALRPHRGTALTSKQFWRIKSDPDIDSDGDGIPNTEEIDGGTDPLDIDSDNDGALDGKLLDTDQDGVPDIHDADPLDKAITWKKVTETPYSVTYIGLPPGVDLADDWNYDLGEGGHVLLSRTTTLTWDDSSQMFDKSSFKTYIYDGKKWSDNLPLSNTIRGLGVSIDSLGNVYGIGYGPPEDANGLGIYAVSFKWDKPVISSTEPDPAWGAPIMEEQRELFTYSTAHEDTTNFINSFYYNSSSGKNFLYGTTGHFIVGSDPVTGRTALHRQNPNGRITTSLPVLNSSVYFHIAGEPNGWHAASWFEAKNSGVQTKHIFSKLTSENLLIDANPPTGDALLQLTDIASINEDYLSAGTENIVIWLNSADGVQIGSGSSLGSFTWQTSTKADVSQRIDGKINGKGEALLPTKLWRNGKWTLLNDLVDSSLWPNIQGIDINDSGTILAQSGAKLVLLKPIVVEMLTDLNNDGKIDSADAILREVALRNGASDSQKDKGTEFLFVNDQLSNGLWDKEDSDTDKPANEKDDDDAQEIKIVPRITEGEVWLEHPAIAGLSFYKTRECNAGDKVNLSPDNKFSVSESNPFPDQLFVRADGQLSLPADNLQIEGDLVLKIKEGGVNGQEIEALKMKFTVVKEFGAKDYFLAVEDYVWENNTKYFVAKKEYGADILRMVFILEDRTLMFPIDAARRPNGGELKGIDSVVAAYPATVTINGSQSFFIDGRSKFLASTRGDITDSCHGRTVRGGILDLSVSSDAHLPAHSNGGRHWSAGPDYSPLAGPEPMPDGSRGGNYFSMVANGNYKMGAGILPSHRFNLNNNPRAGIGGLSANAARRQAAGQEIQAIGHYRKGDTPEGGIIFTASTEQGSGRSVDLYNDAKKSGVTELPGGRQGEIKLLFLDGSSSVALAYDKKDVGMKTVLKYGKHDKIGTYYINSYLIFQSWKPRNN